jgi:excisionase family DNA binding protein
MEMGIVGASAKLFTCAEVAQMLGVGTDWVRRKTQGREVEHVRLGRSVRFTEDQVQGLIVKFTKTVVPLSSACSRL